MLHTYNFWFMCLLETHAHLVRMECEWKYNSVSCCWIHIVPTPKWRAELITVCVLQSVHFSSHLRKRLNLKRRPYWPSAKGSRNPLPGIPTGRSEGLHHFRGAVASPILRWKKQYVLTPGLKAGFLDVAYLSRPRLDTYLRPNTWSVSLVPENLTRIPREKERARCKTNHNHF